ncbi:MAG: LemA family protein [Gammaproteobacteria bacterium]
MSLVAVILSAVLALWGIVIYNLLVRDRNRVAAAWSDVDVQLKRRHDLIPNLVETVKQYAGYERGVLERVVAGRTEALTASTPARKGGTEAALGHDLRRLIAVAEAYPEVKANQGFLDLQRNLSAIEDHIQHARRYYNGAVNNLNTRVDSVPDMIVARGFGFRPAEYFELDRPEEAQPPEDR